MTETKQGGMDIWRSGGWIERDGDLPQIGRGVLASKPYLGVVYAGQGEEVQISPMGGLVSAISR